MSRIRSYISEIFFLSGIHRRGLILIFALFTLLGCIDLLGIGLIGQYVAMSLGVTPVIPRLALPVLNVVPKMPMLWAGVLLLAVFAFKALVGVAANYSVFNIAGKIEARLRAKLLRRYQGLKYEEFVARNSSEYINAINVWAPQYARSVLMPFLRVLAELLVATMILAFLCMVNASAFFIFLGIVSGVTLFYERFLRRINQKYAERFRSLSAVVITDVRQALDGIKEIRVLGEEGFFNQRISKNSQQLCHALAVSNTISNSPRFFLEFAVMAFAVLLVSVVGQQSGGDTLQWIPVVAMFGAGAMRLITLFTLIATTTTQLGFNRKIVHSLYEDLRIEDVVLVSESKKNPEQFAGATAENLGFRYKRSDQPVLNNVNLRIGKGESIALLGPSGSGKSTLVDILLGILPPSAGQVTVTGTPVQKHLAPYSLYLPQATFLMDDTIRRNIALGQPDSEIDDERIRQALKRAHLMETVDHLPEGLNTVVGDRGLRLSGGQRQRIALARAFYLGRTLLFLDEATSAIDKQTEMAILDDLLSMGDKLTIVMITHRTELAHLFDRVYQLIDGRVADVTGDYRSS
jgi:ABC-type bacteriocin/lantibiotic exporter with double-glycine peptidase domain